MSPPTGGTEHRAVSTKFLIHYWRKDFSNCLLWRLPEAGALLWQSLGPSLTLHRPLGPNPSTREFCGLLLYSPPWTRPLPTTPGMPPGRSPTASPPDCEIVRGLLFPASPRPDAPTTAFQAISSSTCQREEGSARNPSARKSTLRRPSAHLLGFALHHLPWPRSPPGTYLAAPTSAPSSPFCVQGPPQAPPAPFLTSFGSVSSGRCHRGLRVACLQTHPYPRSLSAP